MQVLLRFSVIYELVCNYCMHLGHNYGNIKMWKETTVLVTEMLSPSDDSYNKATNTF